MYTSRGIGLPHAMARVNASDCKISKPWEKATHHKKLKSFDIIAPFPISNKLQYVRYSNFDRGRQREGERKGRERERGGRGREGGEAWGRPLNTLEAE